MALALSGLHAGDKDAFSVRELFAGGVDRGDGAGGEAPIGEFSLVVGNFAFELDGFDRDVERLAAALDDELQVGADGAFGDQSANGGELFGEAGGDADAVDAEEDVFGVDAGELGGRSRVDGLNENTSVGLEAEARRQGLRVPFETLCCYPTVDGLVEPIAAFVREAYAARSGKKPRVLFSAHGLPKRTIERGDPYQWQVEQTTAAVIARLGEENGRDDPREAATTSQVDPGLRPRCDLNYLHRISYMPIPEIIKR